MFLSHNSHNLLRLNLVVDSADGSAETYVVTFVDHFYDLFLQGPGGHGPLGSPRSATAKSEIQDGRSSFLSNQ